MKHQIIIVFTISFILLQVNVWGQTHPLSKTEKLRKKKIWSLFKYVQKTPLEQLSPQEMAEKYITYPIADSSQSADPRSKKMFSWLLQGLDGIVDTMQLKEYDAIAWNKFDHAENLPRLLWQAEPITHIFGQPLNKSNTDRSRIVAEGEKQLENTMVLYKKDSPAVPRYFILFDEKSGKIASWTLIKQGPLHYFISF